jgi:hypothetical protein
VAIMTTISALAIIVRHVEDADEGGRTCRACGRPWPCDVRNLVDAMTAEARLVAAAPLSLTHGHHRSPTIMARPGSRIRRLPARVPVA